jgi:hypothetical protein
MHFLLVLCAIFSLSSCGLRPVYSEKHYNKQASDNLSAIDVEQVGSIQGAEFYHRLISILPQKLETKYLLRAQFTEVVTPTIIEKNSNILRESINQLIKYQLIDITTDKVLISDQFHQTTSYNTIFMPYAASVEREKTGIELAHQAAQEIRNRLIIYFMQVKQRQ